MDAAQGATTPFSLVVVAGQDRGWQLPGGAAAGVGEVRLGRLGELRCVCGRLLGRWDGRGRLEIKCPRCGKLMRFAAGAREDERKTAA